MGVRRAANCKKLHVVLAKYCGLCVCKRSHLIVDALKNHDGCRPKRMDDGKQLEIALDVVPGATKVGVLVNDDDPSGLLQRREADRHPAGAQ